MALRFGEMVLVVRTQDFASRNLHRVAGELHTLSREQRAFNAVQQHNMRITRQQDRIMDLKRDRARLKLARDSAAANLALSRAQMAVARSEAITRKSAKGKHMGMGVPRQPTAQHAANLAQLANYENALKQATRTAARYEKELALLPRRYSTLAADSGKLNDELDKNKKSLRDARESVRLLANETRTLEFQTKRSTLTLEKWLARGHAMGRIGRVMQLSGLAGTAAFGVMAKSAADFDTQLKLAATQARDIDAPMGQVAVRSKQIGDAILDMMMRFPASSQEMSDAAYEIFSSLNLEENGIINVAKGLKFLEAANRAAVAGQGTLAESTNAMIILLNDFPDAAPTELFDTMFDIIRYGKMHMSEFNTMLGDVAPAAKGAGQSLEDVGGAMAYLTQVLPKTSRAGVGLRRFFDILQDPLIKQGLKDWGVETQRVNGKLRPLPKIIKDIVKTFPMLKSGQLDVTTWLRDMSQEGAIPGRGLEKGVGKQFTSQGRIAATFLFQGADEYMVRQGQINRNTKEFNKSYEAMMRSQGMHWQIAVNQLKALVIIIGQEALPVFLQLLDYVSRAVKWFKNLDPATKNLIVKLATFASVGMLVVGVLGSISGAIVSMGAVVALFASRWLFMQMAAGTAISGIATKLLWLSNLIRALTIAGALIITIKVLFDWPDRHSTFSGLDDAITGGLDALQNKLEGKRIAFTWGPWLGLEAAKLPFKLDKRGRSDDLKREEKRNAKLAKERAKAEKALKPLTFDKVLADLNSASNMKEYIKAMKEYEEAMGSAGGATSELETRTKNLQKAMKDAFKQEFEAATDRLKNAAQAMRDKFLEIKDANTQMWGTLFQGPVLTSETFDVAKEWGISPALRHINKDIDASNKRFVKFRGNLAKLAKKGVPKEVIDEIAAMGAEEGMSWTEAILKGNNKEFQRFLQVLANRKSEIQKATELDFNRLRKHWEELGKAGADAFIAGLTDENVGLTAFFEKWINNEFPGYAEAAAKAAAAAAAKVFNEENPITTDKGKGKQPVWSTGGVGGGAINANTYARDLMRMGYKTFNPNLVRPGYADRAGRDYPGDRTVTNHYDYSTTVEVKGDVADKQKSKELARKIAFAVRNTRNSPRKVPS